MTRKALLTLLLVSAASLSAGETTPGNIGTTVADFTLRDSAGVERSLSALAEGKRAVVIVFVGTECPIAKLYGPRLAEMARTFEGEGVAFVAVDPNHQDDLTEIAAYARGHELPFPMRSA